jgi:hypothetical protein
MKWSNGERSIGSVGALAMCLLAAACGTSSGSGAKSEGPGGPDGSTVSTGDAESVGPVSPVVECTAGTGEACSCTVTVPVPPGRIPGDAQYTGQSCFEPTELCCADPNYPNEGACTCQDNGGIGTSTYGCSSHTSGYGTGTACQCGYGTTATTTTCNTSNGTGFICCAHSPSSCLCDDAREFGASRACGNGDVPVSDCASPQPLPGPNTCPAGKVRIVTPGPDGYGRSCGFVPPVSIGGGTSSSSGGSSGGSSSGSSSGGIPTTCPSGPGTCKAGDSSTCHCGTACEKVCATCDYYCARNCSTDSQCDGLTDSSGGSLVCSSCPEGVCNARFSACAAQ